MNDFNWWDLPDDIPTLLERLNLEEDDMEDFYLYNIKWDNIT